jgi:hypothetical protein
MGLRIAKLASFAKNRYVTAPTQNGLLRAAAIQLSGEVRLSVDPFS